MIFTQSPGSNTDLFQKHTYGHTRNNVVSVIWASLSPVKFSHKIKHHKVSAKILTDSIQEHYYQLPIPKSGLKPHTILPSAMQ